MMMSEHNNRQNPVNLGGNRPQESTPAGRSPDSGRTILLWSGPAILIIQGITGSAPIPAGTENTHRWADRCARLR